MIVWKFELPCKGLNDIKEGKENIETSYILKTV